MLIKYWSQHRTNRTSNHIMGDDHNLAFDPIILAFLKYIMNVLGIVGTRKISFGPSHQLWSFPSALVLPISFGPSHQLWSFPSASVLPISFGPSHQLRSFPSASVLPIPALSSKSLPPTHVRYQYSICSWILWETVPIYCYSLFGIPYKFSAQVRTGWHRSVMEMLPSVIP